MHQTAMQLYPNDPYRCIAAGGASRRGRPLRIERVNSSLPRADARNGIADFILIKPPVAGLAEQRTVSCIGL